MADAVVMQMKLRPILDEADSPSEFLAAVKDVLERLFVEEDDECPDGFTALDEAVEAFEECEEVDDDEEEDE